MKDSYNLYSVAISTLFFKVDFSAVQFRHIRCCEWRCQSKVKARATNSVDINEMARQEPSHQDDNVCKVRLCLLYGHVLLISARVLLSVASLVLEFAKYLPLYVQIQQTINWCYVFLLIPENRLWHFMQIVSWGDNLREMSKPVFWEQNRKIFQNVVCCNFWYPAC